MSAFKQAAEELLGRRTAGTKAPSLNESIRPQSIEDALNIHQQMMEIQSVKAWKCLLPPAEGKIVAAPIFNFQTAADTITLLADKGVANIEPEIGFVLAKDLPAQDKDYSEAEIVDAIGSAHMALELMQRRFADDAGQNFYESLADCMLNQGMFLGPEINKQAAINAHSVQITIAQESGIQELEGKHPNPRAVDGLLWIINYMNKRGVSFHAGEAFITGSFKGIVNVNFDEVTTICYDNLGEYSVTFKAQ